GRPWAWWPGGGGARPAQGWGGGTVVVLGAGGGAGAAVGVGGLGGTAGDSAPVQPPSHAARANAPTVARVAIRRGLIASPLPAPAGRARGGGGAPPPRAGRPPR